MAVTFNTSVGSTTVTVNDAGHGAEPGDYVVIEDVSGLSAQLISDLTNEFEVVTVPNPNSYTITIGSPADQNNTASGQASALYLLPTGLDTTVLGPGWGAGTWGRFTWGSPAGNLAGQTLRLWFADDYGEDLIFNVADGGIYYWDATGGGRGIDITNLKGASDAPVVARKVLVSEVDRHVICFGANPLGSTVQDPLLIRWSSQESVTDWTPTATNTAGDIRLSQGSEIVTAVRTSRQTLIWTDRSMHSMQFIGPPYTFGIAQLGDNTQIVGPNAVVAVNDIVFWMGRDNFYLYDGRIQTIPCTVRDYVFGNLNRNQAFKIHAGSLAGQSEIWWFYCTENSDEVNRYVIYNYLEQAWYYGTLARTAWNDQGTGERSYPQAAGTDRYIYDQEFGLDDGSTTPATALTAFVQSADFDIGDGQQFMFISKLIPDLSFNGSTAATPQVEFSMIARNFSGSTSEGTDTGTVVRTTLVGGEHDYTDQLFMRLRGRQMAIRIESDTTGVRWRLGAPRLDMRPDGRR